MGSSQLASQENATYDGQDLNTSNLHMIARAWVSAGRFFIGLLRNMPLNRRALML